MYVFGGGGIEGVPNLSQMFVDDTGNNYSCILGNLCDPWAGFVFSVVGERENVFFIFIFLQVSYSILTSHCHPPQKKKKV